MVPSFLGARAPPNHKKEIAAIIVAGRFPSWKNLLHLLKPGPIFFVDKLFLKMCEVEGWRQATAGGEPGHNGRLD